MGVHPAKLFHVKELAKALSKQGIVCKTVVDSDTYDGFPNRQISSWFQTAKKANCLFDEFKPDAVLVDRNGHFAKAVLDEKLRLLTHLRGDYWSELQWYKETTHKRHIKRLCLYIRSRMEERCFREATMILPICNYLKDIVERRYPNKSATIYQGIDPAKWISNDNYKDNDDVELKHPCVGLLQSANIWGKTREMLTLPKVMEAMPDVTFYWAGDGPYRDWILPTLSKYDNFKWLGNLNYPDDVKKYLAKIDIYALISGIDMAPLTLQEAQLMQKPVLATSVGGIPELMQDGSTGFLVGLRDHEDIAVKINELLSDEKRSRKMGRNGRQFVEDNFNWDKIATDFIKIAKSAID